MECKCNVHEHSIIGTCQGPSVECSRPTKFLIISINHFRQQVIHSLMRLNLPQRWKMMASLNPKRKKKTSRNSELKS